jgi:hypothetical protein
LRMSFSIQFLLFIFFFKRSQQRQTNKNHINMCNVRHPQLLYRSDCTTAKAVTRQLFTAEAQLQSQDSQCGICGRQSGPGTDFSHSRLLWVLPVSITIPTFHIRPSINRGMNDKLTTGHSVREHSLTPPWE